MTNSAISREVIKKFCIYDCWIKSMEMITCWNLKSLLIFTLEACSYCHLESCTLMHSQVIMALVSDFPVYYFIEGDSMFKIEMVIGSPS